MAWDHPGQGKQSKGKGPATKKARRRRRATREAQAQLEEGHARRRMAATRHRPRFDDDRHSTLADRPVDEWQAQTKPRRGRAKPDRY